MPALDPAGFSTELKLQAKRATGPGSFTVITGWTRVKVRDNCRGNSFQGNKPSVGAQSI